MKRILIVGAGLSGAVIADQLSKRMFNTQIDVIDSRNHIGGNCHSDRNFETGVMVHKYGPHIFHTNDKEVWDYVNAFAEFNNYTLRVKATSQGKVYSLPINLHTINQFFSRTFNPTEASAFIESLSETVDDVKSFEDQALKFVGRDLYNAFFKYYPLKQWEITTDKLPASILQRLPVRFDYNDNYFSHKYQGIPVSGYTDMIGNMLLHNCIRVRLNVEFNKHMCKDYDHVFFSGKLDKWFEYSEGRLQYRTLKFDYSNHVGDYQGCAVMSYPGADVAHTRVVEHKHFAPWESHDKTTIHHEYSALAKDDDIPYYPIRLVEEQPALSKYIELANNEKNVTFVGRLGTYRYLDMDVTIREAIDCTTIFSRCNIASQPMPAFTHK